MREKLPGNPKVPEKTNGQKSGEIHARKNFTAKLLACQTSEIF